MKSARVILSALACLASAGCVAGGSYDAGNRALAGVAIGALLGGAAGQAAGNPMTGAMVGAIAGGGVGAAINPSTFERGTRGYCYTVDPQGRPIVVELDSAACKAAGGAPAPEGG